MGRPTGQLQRPKKTSAPLNFSFLKLNSLFIYNNLLISSINALFLAGVLFSFLFGLGPERKEEPSQSVGARAAIELGQQAKKTNQRRLNWVDFGLVMAAGPLPRSDSISLIQQINSISLSLLLSLLLAEHLIGFEPFELVNNKEKSKVNKGEKIEVD